MGVLTELRRQAETAGVGRRAMRDHVRLVIFGLLSTLLTGCGGISTGAHGLRNFSWNSNNACNADQPLPVVTGVLRADPGQVDPVWLVDRVGNRLSVVWPAGFTILFDVAPAVLLNERGQAVATDGDWVTLGQTRASDSAGTFDDPYYASGLTLGGCYAR